MRLPWAEVHFVDGTSLLNAADGGYGNRPVAEWTDQWAYVVVRTTFTF